MIKKEKKKKSKVHFFDVQGKKKRKKGKETFFLIFKKFKLYVFK